MQKQSNFYFVFNQEKKQPDFLSLQISSNAKGQENCTYKTRHSLKNTTNNLTRRNYPPKEKEREREWKQQPLMLPLQVNWFLLLTSTYEQQFLEQITNRHIFFHENLIAHLVLFKQD